MKNWLYKIYPNRYFLLFIMLFAYVQSIYSRISVREEINAYTFTPDGALFSLFEAGVLFIITLYFIKIWQKSDVFSTKEMLKIFGSSLITHPLVMQIIGLVIALIFNKIERNFNLETFTYTTFTFFLNGFIYGSFFIAYYYHNKNKNHQQQLTNYHQALSESRINQLKTQLNPHFLFNNLNVLDQLIEEDKHKASEFLNEFADIYRYVLKASDKKLVPLDEELAFAEQYFKLIQHKYGLAYQLKIESSASGYIVPLTMQLLIENAIQHNFGSKENPVHIKIETTDTICISNNFIPKRSSKPTSGRALQNINEQYKLLTQKPIEIKNSDAEFAVIIPIIKLQ
ncbi:MAG: histidine kinase [Flavobacterium sp.]|uniref:sensor histidine kinase n=1 Tax=Flavobacterium sp. TaxID=239 RepID=UPI002628FCF0|nr:histidine kinase [Flavobacterium sp.]MDD5150105.1 histidine kinase [Flavobacterium sp.]